MRPIRFPKFIDEILAVYRATRAPATWCKMRQVLGEFGGVPGVRTTADLDPARVAAFVAASRARGRHDNTTATLASYLRAACSYAVARGYLVASPFGQWRSWVTPLPPRPTRHHGREAITRVLGRLRAGAGSFEGGRLYVLAAIYAYTGLRRDEALHLRVEDLDLAAGVLTVSARRRLKRPGSSAREVPICPELGAILAAWLPRVEGRGGWVIPNRSGTNPWRGGAPGYRPADRLRAAAQAAGVADFLPHSLRHSFGTHAATAWGWPPAALHGVMGHSSIRVTMRYYVHQDRANLAELARGIRLDLPAA